MACRKGGLDGIPSRTCVMSGMSVKRTVQKPFLASSFLEFSMLQFSLVIEKTKARAGRRRAARHGQAATCRSLKHSRKTVTAKRLKEPVLIGEACRCRDDVCSSLARLGQQGGLRRRLDLLCMHRLLHIRWTGSGMIALRAGTFFASRSDVLLQFHGQMPSNS